jgi:plastocyanin
MRPSRLIPAALVFLAAGCASEPRAVPPDRQLRLAVREADFVLSPAHPRLRRAGVVAIRVKNEGQTEHALEVDGPKGTSRTGALPPGGAATLRVDLSRPGRYAMYCPLDRHRERGMSGSISSPR